MSAHAVRSNGLDPQGYIVEMIRDDVLWLGRPKIMIRSDYEPALLRVVETALAALKAKEVASNSERVRTLRPTDQRRSRKRCEIA